MTRRQRQLHEHYGPVFRVAPDEISSASEEAWNDIGTYGEKDTNAPSEIPHSLQGHEDNLITTSNVRFHARVRGLMSHFSTEESLRAQSTLIERHANPFVRQFAKSANANENREKGALFNLTDWLNFFTMDIAGTSQLLSVQSRC